MAIGQFENLRTKPKIRETEGSSMGCTLNILHPDALLSGD